MEGLQQVYEPMKTVCKNSTRLSFLSDVHSFPLSFLKRLKSTAAGTRIDGTTLATSW